MSSTESEVDSVSSESDKEEETTTSSTTLQKTTSEPEIESVTLPEEEEPKKIYTKDYQLHNILLPTKERIVPEVEAPVSHYLTDEQFWREHNIPNTDMLREHFRREGRITPGQMQDLIDLVYDIFCSEDNVLYIDAPLTVCGDIHGQYYDLLKLFEVGGDPSKTRYLFLGDYVDRGNFSMECVLLLFACKVAYPDTFFLLRGNHECRHVTEFFSFKEECLYKYDKSTYDCIMDTFDALPLAAIMNKQFLCVHGGLSPELETVQDFFEIDRYQEPASRGPMCDILWSDPVEDYDNVLHPSSTPYEVLFTPNDVRSCSYTYPFQAALKFLERNRLLSVIRAHEAQAAGYKMHRRNDKTGFPTLITLFSAPNYLDVHGNKGAILRYENNVFNIRQFNHSPHPYYLPGFMNAFAWSMPFVAEKVAELLITVLNLVDDVQAEREEDLFRRKEVIRRKVMTVSKLLMMYKKMRDEREALVLAGSLSPRGRSLPRTLSVSAEETNVTESVFKKLSSSLEEDTFKGARSLDLPNEARPPDMGQLSYSVMTPQQLKRYASRDKILLRKRNSLGAKNHQEIVKDAPEHLPKINETENNIK